jgi:uncharacterized protein YodC (DUF2158 family)
MNNSGRQHDGRLGCRWFNCLGWLNAAVAIGLPIPKRLADSN